MRLKIDSSNVKHKCTKESRQLNKCFAFTFVCWFTELAIDFVILVFPIKIVWSVLKSATCMYLFFVYRCEDNDVYNVYLLNPLWHMKALY